MIIEIIAGSITTIVCSSLWFVSVLDKRERAEYERELLQERKLQQEREEQLNPKQVKIYPYDKITRESSCVLCGASGQKRGLGLPKACTDDTCPARKKEHLHIWCVSCRGSYYMATRDY